MPSIYLKESERRRAKIEPSRRDLATTYLGGSRRLLSPVANAERIKGELQEALKTLLQSMSVIHMRL